jgi:hypothetical protein
MIWWWRNYLVDLIILLEGISGDIVLCGVIGKSSVDVNVEQHSCIAVTACPNVDRTPGNSGSGCRLLNLTVTSIPTLESSPCINPDPTFDPKPKPVLCTSDPRDPTMFDNSLYGIIWDVVSVKIRADNIAFTIHLSYIARHGLIHRTFVRYTYIIRAAYILRAAVNWEENLRGLTY